MNQNERPVPPEGAQSAPPVTPPVTNQGAPKNKQSKSTGSGGGVKSFLYGLLGGVSTAWARRSTTGKGG